MLDTAAILGYLIAHRITFRLESLVNVKTTNPVTSMYRQRLSPVNSQQLQWYDKILTFATSRPFNSGRPEYSVIHIFRMHT